MLKTSKQPEHRLPTHTEIAARAHQIYLARGGQPRHDKDDWLQAEYELTQLPISKIAVLGTAKSSSKKSKQTVLKQSALVALVQTALVLGANRLT